MSQLLTFESPIGSLTLVGSKKGLEALHFGVWNGPASDNSSCPYLLEGKKQIDAYFAKKLTVFSLPIHLKGTDFQKSVWEELYKIPYGKTKTYGEIAFSIGNPKASRAVGGACHNNPLCIIVPCHRVVGSNGSLTGFGGGIETKEALLRLEGCLL